MNRPQLPRVLITGASGLLGFSLRRVMAEGFELLTPDLDEFDVLRPREATDWIVAARPNLVIHAAAYTAVDRAEAEPEAAMAINRDGTRAVAEGAREVGACLMYVSTDYVFDGKGTEPWDELREPRPLGAYGASKLAGEEEVREILSHFLIVRTAWIFGPGRPNFVLTMARRALANEPSRVVDDQRGCPTYTPHLAGAMRSLYERRVQGVVHVVNEGACSWYELTREIYRLLGADPELVTPMTTAELQRPAPRPAVSVLSTERLGRSLGRRLPPWREALREYLDDRRLWEDPAAG